LLPSEALQVTVSVASNVPVRRVPVETLGQLQTIADDDDDFVPPAEMIQRLLDDNRHIAEAQREAIDVCDQNNDSPTGNLLQEMLDQTERRIWFLFEISQGADSTA
jgi:starvation-inducible DNA-binding protein